MEFSIARLFKLMKKDFLVHRKFLLLSVISLFGVCALIVFFVANQAEKGRFFYDAGGMVFFMLLIVCGSIITASIFGEFSSTTKRVQYLSIPASNFEKLLSKWFYTLPFYLILVVIIFCLGYQVFGYWIGYMMDVDFVPLKDHEFDYFEYAILGYFIIHSVIFFFSIIFNGYPIPKIMVAGSVCGILAFITILLLTRVILYDHFTGLFRETELMKNTKPSDNFKLWVEEFFTNLPYLFALIGVPFIWVISYFKMKEKEA